MIQVTSLNGLEQMTLAGLLSLDAVMSCAENGVAEMLEADAMFCLDAPEFLPAGSMISQAGCVEGVFVNTVVR